MNKNELAKEIINFAYSQELLKAAPKPEVDLPLLRLPKHTLCEKRKASGTCILEGQRGCCSVAT